MEEFILSNGLRILLHPMSNTHSVTIGLYIKAGLCVEPKSGITHLLEHLHFRQLQNTSQTELYYRMEKIGSTLRATTYRDFLKFSMKVAPCYLVECLDVFSDLIDATTWDESNVAKEKQVVINQILESRNYLSIDQMVNEFLFRDHPYSHEIMGSVEDVTQITTQDITDYKRTIFRADGMMICITGKIDDANREKIVSKLRKCNISSQPLNIPSQIPRDFGKRKSAIKLVPIQDGNLLDVNLSYDIVYDREDVLFLSLLNCILGEGVGSRLQCRIREECCYTSDIASFIEWYQDFAILHIRFTVHEKHLTACLQEISAILRDMQNNISVRDLAVSIPFYTTNLMFLEDDTEEMNFDLAYYRFILNHTKKQPQIQNGQATVIRIQRLAEKIFIPQNLSLVIVGNTKSLTKKALSEIL